MMASALTSERQWKLLTVSWLVAFYHCLLYGGFIPAALQPCGKGLCCSAQKLELAGFITIPLLSLLAFSIIVLLLLVAKKDYRK